MFSRALMACILAATLSGCGGATFFGPATGTVSGHVQIRACGGAYRPEQTGCPARPMAGATITFQMVNSSSASTITTDSSGAYRIDLAPGTYNVRVTGEGSAQRELAGLAGPRTVAIVAGKSLTADLTYTIQLQ